MRDPGPVIIEATKDHIVATFQRLAFVIFERETLPQVTTPLFRALDEVVASYPEGAGLLTVVAENAPLPSSEARDALAMVMRGKGARIKVSAVCIEGQGFGAAARRGVAASLTMLSKPLFPHKVFGTLEEAGVWLAAELPKPPMNARAIVRAVDIARGNVMSIADSARES